MVWLWEFKAKRLRLDATKWSLFSALCIHKVPEGLALGSLLIGAGLQRAAALGWVAAVEATTLLGGVIGYFFLANISMFWLGLIMAHVGGGFIYLATHAVVGEMLKHGKKLVLTSFSAGGRTDRVSQCCIENAWVAHASRVLVIASSQSRTFLWTAPVANMADVQKDCFGVTLKPTRETRALPMSDLEIAAPCR